jgi:hypothetical protein
MAKVSDLKDKIFRATGHKYTDFIYMLQLLNDALTDLTDEAKLEDKVTINVVPGQDTYALPANFKTPRSLVDETTDKDLRQDYQLLDITENKYGYSIFNGNLIMKPVPQEQKDLSLYYYKFAADLVNDSDVPDIDQHYHNLLATYAIAMILGMQPDVPRWNVEKYQADWIQGKRQFTAEMQKKRKLSRVRESIQW